jgi:hypothetical protein
LFTGKRHRILGRVFQRYSLIFALSLLQSQHDHLKKLGRNVRATNRAPASCFRLMFRRTGARVNNEWDLIA